MAEDATVKKARAEAAVARERLIRSAHELRARVSPSRLANDALEGAREKSTAALDTVSDTARRRPGLAAGIAVGVLAILARRPILRLFHRPKQTTLAGPTRHALPRPSGDTE